MIYANNIKDKVVSIGEGTNIELKLKNVSNSFLAAAIKDGSIANIKMKNINTNGPHIMSFDKKGFLKNTRANVIHQDSSINKKLNKYITNNDAKLIINGKSIKPIEINTKELYRKGPMKKTNAQIFKN